MKAPAVPMKGEQKNRDVFTVDGIYIFTPLQCNYNICDFAHGNTAEIVLYVWWALKKQENGKMLIFMYKIYTNTIIHRICPNKRPGRSIFRSNKTNFKTHQRPSVSCTPPLWKIIHQHPSVSCTPPFEKSPIKSHRFCVLPPLKNHPSKPIGFVYSPLWKTTVFGGRSFRGGRLFRQIR